MTCGIVWPVTDLALDEHEEPKHRMPLAMSHEARSDALQSASQMMMAAANQQPEAVIQQHRDDALSQFEACLDLMLVAGREAGRLKP